MISHADTVVSLLMGPTGTGKSTVNQAKKTAGDSLHSETSQIRAIRVLHPRTKLPIVLVDTPGFNDTNMSDTQVLSMIAKWLETTYKRKVQLSGIIYLHRISDNRMSGSPLKNLNMFGRLCGDGAIEHVILVTTMWDRVKEEVGVPRESELKKKYWHQMIQLGSTTQRFRKTPESAWDIIDSLEKKGVALLLQEEMVNLKLLLSETEAGKTLYSTLQKQVADQQDTIRKLREEAETEKNPQLVEELTRQYNELREGLQITFEQIERLKIPFSRKIMGIFRFKKAVGRALKLLNK
ncbi:hypothetical protein BDZ94DRAFT_1280464 [Collybia nuda]|uniref:AIG1-type G domain-containing protein n=1 Tax=Collybia nuda TaxID=64659 RepID=A0A9P5YBU8_9AGAR|nr:hypothetical protein BDZ94DRAFT_1280464 [Collybia nuda]